MTASTHQLAKVVSFVRMFLHLCRSRNCQLAQSVKRWTPCGWEHTFWTGTHIRGSRRNGHSMLMSLRTGMVAVGGRPHIQATPVKEPAVRGYVRT